MKIRFTVTLEDTTVEAFARAGHVTPTGIVQHLSSTLKKEIEVIKDPRSVTSYSLGSLGASPFEEDESGEDDPVECAECGKEYVVENSKANDPDNYCSRKCEKAAEGDDD